MRKLLVADDHALVREGVVGLLQEHHSDWTFEEAGTLDQTLAVLSAQSIDLLLLDLNMPGMEMGASVQVLRECYPATRIAVLTGNDDRSTILECMAAGAHGYLLKCDAVGQLMTAIDAVLQGQIYVPPSLAQIGRGSTVSLMMKPLGQQPAQGFTPRQADVLRLLAEGRSTKDIARRLNLGVGTIKVHLAGVYRVLGARNRTEAVVKASKVQLDS